METKWLCEDWYREAVMDRAISVVLIIVGVAFLAFSLVGLANSDLDTREVLLIGLGFAGVALLAIGVRQLTNKSDSST